MANKLFPRRIILLGMLALFVGCANNYRVPLRPPDGILLTSRTVPLTLDFPEGGLPVADVTKVTVDSGYLLWPYPMVELAWGDLQALGSLPRGGALKRVVYADAEIFTVLGLVGRYTVNLYGPAAE